MKQPRANWSPAIETGLPAIDSQNKALLNLVTVDAAYVDAVKASQKPVA